jgi:hypothetical protein
VVGIDELVRAYTASADQMRAVPMNTAAAFGLADHGVDPDAFKVFVQAAIKHMEASIGLDDAPERIAEIAFLAGFHTALSLDRDRASA